MALSKSDIQAWADHLWRASEATLLDEDGRALARALLEKCTDDPEQAALLIAGIAMRDSVADSKTDGAA